MAKSLTGYDALLTPTLDRPVIPLVTMAGTTPMDRYMADCNEWFDRLFIANTSGWPAISVPAATAGPLPIGLQLMAPPGSDRLLLRLARDLTGHAVVPVAVPQPDIEAA
jgi:amidase